MKHSLTFVGVMFAAVALHAQEPSTFKFEVQTRMPLETRTVKNAPYSAEVITDHMQQLADGNRIVEHSSGRVYRDKEGRVRREEDRPGGPGFRGRAYTRSGPPRRDELSAGGVTLAADGEAAGPGLRWCTGFSRRFRLKAILRTQPARLLRRDLHRHLLAATHDAELHRLALLVRGQQRHVGLDVLHRLAADGDGT